uniref:Ribosomal protein S13 n=1 Tax=Cyanoptyche gloeocystis TaxID=77922 RepID=A0A096Y6Y6_9EUKA|nr:ribosomal protein S13 [Cyanoptyche gloeocystis]AIM52092.1 ribosomal protein S13 [Cyanoptyche gloeocystis]
MAYIKGIYFEKKKTLTKNFKFIKGINNYKTVYILSKLYLHPRLKFDKVESYQINSVKRLLNNKKKFLLQSDLKNYVTKQILNKINLNTYAGNRHKLGLPVHNQRTHSNAQTRKRIKYGTN